MLQAALIRCSLHRSGTNFVVHMHMYLIFQTFWHSQTLGALFLQLAQGLMLALRQSHWVIHCSNHTSRSDVLTGTAVAWNTHLGLSGRCWLPKRSGLCSWVELAEEVSVFQKQMVVTFLQPGPTLMSGFPQRVTFGSMKHLSTRMDIFSPTKICCWLWHGQDIPLALGMVKNRAHDLPWRQENWVYQSSFLPVSLWVCPRNWRVVYILCHNLLPRKKAWRILISSHSLSSLMHWCKPSLNHLFKRSKLPTLYRMQKEARAVW